MKYKKLEKTYYFIYNSEKEKINSSIKVEFNTRTSMNQEEYDNYKKLFNEYLKNNTSEDIVDIVINLKEIFNNLDENRLSILIENMDDEFFQEVEYLNGKLSRFNFTIKDWSNIISVSNDYFGTNIRYKKSCKMIKTKEDIKSIYDELNIYLEKVYKLTELETNKEEEKVKKYTN